MTATLEDRIRQVFDMDAARAPMPDAAWRGPTVGVTVVPRSRRRPILMMSAVAAVVVAVVATGYVVTRPDDDSPSAAWQPAGVEYPLVDLGPATSSHYITAAGLSRMVQIPGQPVLTIARTIQYAFGASAEEQLCEDFAGGAGCAPDYTWGKQPDISVSSSVDNRVADEDIWMWDGLPQGTTYVEYVDGNSHMWQRPIAGFAAFPDVKGRSEVATAFADDGTVLGRAGGGVIDAPTQAVGTGEVRADIDSVQNDELVLLTSATMHDCLTQSGGTWDSFNVATFAAGVDELSIWTECVAKTKQVVGARVAEMNVRTYDPAVDQPLNPNSPIHTVNAADCHTVSTNPDVTECSATNP